MNNGKRVLFRWMKTAVMMAVLFFLVSSGPTITVGIIRVSQKPETVLGATCAYAAGESSGQQENSAKDSAAPPTGPKSAQADPTNDGTGARLLRVGMYQNPPKVFTDEAGLPAGIFVDLLAEIAKNENWNLVYVPGDWTACLLALKEHRIDLMPDVAYSRERAELYDFHESPVAESWSQVYANPLARVSTFADLNGRRIAVLKGAIQNTVFQQMMEGFGYKVTVVEAESYEDAFKLASKGAADAAISNNYFGNYFFQKYGLAMTPIVFNPVSLYFATAKGRDSDLLKAIDQNLNNWRSEPNSPYYTILQHWTGNRPQRFLPQYLVWISIIICGVLVLAAGIILLLRVQVRLRTRHLVQAIESLGLANARFQRFVDADITGIVIANAEGRVIEANDYYLRTIGFTREEFDQGIVDWRAITPLDWLPADEQAIRELRDSGACAPYEKEYYRRDGVRVPVFLAVAMLPGAEEEIAAFVLDITERKRAEDALQAKERQLSIIYGNTSDVVFYLSVEPNSAYRFVSVNQAFLNVTGMNEDQVVGKLYRDVIPEPAQTMVLGKYRTAIQERKTVQWEEVSEYPAGTKAGIVSVTPVFDKFGTCTNLIGTVHDITERRNAEEEVRKLNAELEQRVELRTAQLSEANRELDAFAHSVSHDLRAPLRGIDGWSMALLEDYADTLDATGREYLDRVRSETQRMGQLIDDMLQLSRVGRAEMRRVEVDLSALTQSLANRLRDRQPDRQVEFVIQPGMVVEGDPGLLAIALGNLLDNAFKFTCTRPQARIELGSQNGDGDERVFFVRDNGVGFDMTYVDKLFSAFQRLHRASDFPGTGIGLVTTQRIIRRHGGRIWVEAEVDQGAVFYFTLGEEKC